MPVYYGYERTITQQDDTSAGGRVIARTTTTSTVIMPDNSVKREQKDTFLNAPLGGGFSGSGLQRSKSDQTTREFQPSIYGPNGLLNQPKPTSEITRSYGWVRLPNVTALAWREVARTETQYAYNAQSFLSLQTTTTYKLRVSTGELLPDTQKAKKVSNTGSDFTSTSTDEFTWNSRTGTWTPNAGTDVASGAGKRPGGIKSGG